jgi:hypothetical protein
VKSAKVATSEIAGSDTQLKNLNIPIASLELFVPEMEV